jgi:hypothetical protein
MMDAPYLASSPAEFWRRYNRPVHQFFGDDVYRPVGGVRNPVLGVLAVFAASAVIHEYVFLPAIGCIQGYQTAFFLVQGLGVLATRKARPGGVLPILATLVFHLAASARSSPASDRSCRSTRLAGPSPIPRDSGRIRRRETSLTREWASWIAWGRWPSWESV